MPEQVSASTKQLISTLNNYAEESFVSSNTTKESLIYEEMLNNSSNSAAKVVRSSVVLNKDNLPNEISPNKR